MVRPAGSAAGALVPRWFRHALKIALHLILDAAAVTSGYRIAYRLRFHSRWLTVYFPVIGADPGWELYAHILYTVVPLWVGLFWYSSRIYNRLWITLPDRFLQIFKGAFLGTCATLAATYIYSRLEYSRLMLLLAGPLAALCVCAAHFVTLKIDAWMAGFETASPLILIGDGKVADLISENIRTHHPRVAICTLSRLPAASDILALTAAQGASEVVLVKSDIPHAKLLELAEACETAGLSFKMIPDLLELRFGEIQMDDSLGLPAYRLQHTSLTRANFLAKRTFDILFSLAILAMAGLPLAMIALLIRLDSKGPALYHQKRVGFKGRTFEACKFRTMVMDAEAALAEVRKSNDQEGGFFKAKKDPRVTRVGRLLRRFSIDEFPQFLNVLKGDMSVVGPRPLAVATAEMSELIENFGPTARKRMNMLPGITGLWQVSGRSDISAEQRFALDMFYIEHWSLGLDLEIILKTVPAMLSAKGAY